MDSFRRRAVKWRSRFSLRSTPFAPFATTWLNPGHRLYWVRVPGYFCQFFLEPPKAVPERGGPERIRGEVIPIIVADEQKRRLLHAILNSSTYYQFFCVYTDGRHINPSDVLEFPLDIERMSTEAALALSALSIKLEKCMRANTKKWRKSGLLIDSVVSAPCKTVIDAIDRELGKHYSFTDEELDFIINYDIKYRMGRDSQNEEDE
jgi:hypothetical protein